ncbi:MAG: glycosyl transferase [Clostridia bacterium]|nr:glycosyl transferase [Clostridia bacterium]
MSKLKSFFSVLKSGSQLAMTLDANHLTSWLSDEAFSKIAFKQMMGYELNLKNPSTFNEKLQWLKIYDHRPEYTDLVDKIKAKEIVGKKIGQEHIVPIYGAWKRAEEIDFDSLPDQFVLKCNHDQGSVILVPDKGAFDRASAVAELNKKLKRNNFYGTREFPYKNVPPRVFAEQYLQSNITDYKFYCFNGEPRFLYCGMGLTTDHSLKIDFFDLDWNLMPFYRTDYGRLGMVPRPDSLDEMIRIARILSAEVPFVRIDLFAVEGRVYFSEYTLYPAAGFMRFMPEKYDRIVGEWLELPDKTEVENGR